MTETQFCLLSMSSVTDCQTGSVGEFDEGKGEEGRGKGGKRQVKKCNGKREDSIAGGGDGVGITGNYCKGELKEAERGKRGGGPFTKSTVGSFYPPPDYRAATARRQMGGGRKAMMRR